MMIDSTQTLQRFIGLTWRPIGLQDAVARHVKAKALLWVWQETFEAHHLSSLSPLSSCQPSAGKKIVDRIVIKFDLCLSIIKEADPECQPFLHCALMN